MEKQKQYVVTALDLPRCVVWTLQFEFSLLEEGLFASHVENDVKTVLSSLLWSTQWPVRMNFVGINAKKIARINANKRNL